MNLKQMELLVGLGIMEDIIKFKFPLQYTHNEVQAEVFALLKIAFAE